VGISASLFLIAVGAILAFGVHVSNSSGFDVNTIGVILLIVGVLGMILSMLFWSTWGGLNRRQALVAERRSRRRVVEEVPARRVVEERPLRRVIVDER